MKLKKFAKVLLSCALAGVLFTGCGGGQSGDKPAGDKPAGKQEVTLGMISYLNATEQKMDGILAKVEEETGVTVTHHIPKFYDSLRTLQMGIESGSVDEISVYNCVADYIIAKNNKFSVISDDVFAKTFNDNFCFAVRKDDTQLKADLDKAIEEMKADGTLDKLINDYITNVDKENVPKVEIPMTEGAPTIKIGVTGDLPPLDYVNEDGTPAGFNTAMLAEIAKRLGRNIEIVDIDSGARAAALSSKQIDVVFWAVIPNGDKMPVDIDRAEGLEFSEPYFKDGVSHLKYNK